VSSLPEPLQLLTPCCPPSPLRPDNVRLLPHRRYPSFVPFSAPIAIPFPAGEPSRLCLGCDLTGSNPFLDDILVYDTGLKRRPCGDRFFFPGMEAPPQLAPPQFGCVFDVLWWVVGFSLVLFFFFLSHSLTASPLPRRWTVFIFQAFNHLQDVPPFSWLLLPGNFHPIAPPGRCFATG